MTTHDPASSPAASTSSAPEGGGMPRWLWFLLGGLVLCAGVVPCTGVIAAIAIPNYIKYQLSAKRAEVPGAVAGIKAAMLAYDAAHDGVLACGSRDEAEGSVRHDGKVARPWQGASCWTEIGWAPDGDVRGAYWVEVMPTEGSGTTTFVVHGVSDVDSDGILAEYTARSDRGVEMVTAPEVY